MPSLAEGERQIDKVVASYSGTSGTVYLTDRRLLFEYSEGTIHKKFHQLGVSLNDISNVNANHSRFGVKQLVFNAKNSNNGFLTNQIILNIAAIPEQWLGKINNLLASQSSTRPTAVVVEREVVKIPCKYCGNLIDAFRNNTCDKCGAPIR